MIRRFANILAPVKKRLFSAAGNDVGASSGTDTSAVTQEQQLSATLRRGLPGITFVSVEDISGGCGAMFDISVEAKEFVGLSTVKQHRLVTDTLKREISEMHGIRIHTSVPKDIEKPGD